MSSGVMSGVLLNALYTFPIKRSPVLFPSFQIEARERHMSPSEDKRDPRTASLAHPTVGVSAPQNTICLSRFNFRWRDESRCRFLAERKRVLSLDNTSREATGQEYCPRENGVVAKL